MRTKPSDPERVGRLGRRVGLAVFALIVTAFTLVCSIEIVLQVWAPEVQPLGVGCRDGVAGLLRAVRRARTVAALERSGERARVERFRTALLPEWTARPALENACANDAPLATALDEIDRYRYAEEQKCRAEATEVAERRRRMLALEQELEPGARPATEGP
jgi:hypothetical protein